MSEKLINKIDLAIGKLADDITKDKIADSFKAETVKALTGLIAVRAQLLGLLL